MKELGFETSRALKQIFTTHFDQWRKKHRLSLDDLAARCGVSPAYLAHISRYGRIPSRPVLILLALNFELDDPQILLTAAKMSDPWPFETHWRFSEGSNPRNDGFFSLKFDIDAFTTAIRDIVRAETKPRSVHGLLGHRPLKVGINPLKAWLCENSTLPLELRDGFFQDFLRTVASSLQISLEFSAIEFVDYPSHLAQGTLDLYGPVVCSPNLPQGASFSSPLYQIGMSALFRTQALENQALLDAPKSIQDLLNPLYRIAAIRNGRGHLIASTVLKRRDSDIIFCNDFDEALDTLTVRSTKRSAHVLLCNSVDAVTLNRTNSNVAELVFPPPDKLLDVANCGVAVRSDWPELLEAVNKFITFTAETGVLAERFKKWIPQGFQGALMPRFPEKQPDYTVRNIQLQRAATRQISLL